MGHVHLSRQSAVDFFTETVGYKAGVVIDAKRLAKMISSYDEELAVQLHDPNRLGFRFHSSEVQGIVAHLLFKVGNIDDPSTALRTIQLYHKVKNSPFDLACYKHVMECYTKYISEELRKPYPPGTELDPEKFMRASMDPFGRTGLDMAVEVLKGINHQLHISPWGEIRSTNWTDAIELESLFSSEDLTAQYGRFFDQRFIDYLEANFDQIGNIHWRKFEGLTGEYFDREGFIVDVGPGRNDDGIDLRIYPAERRDDAPPLMIVQCKRQKGKDWQSTYKVSLCRCLT